MNDRIDRMREQMREQMIEKCTAKGAKIYTPFQRDPAHKRWNSYGCQ